VPPPPQQDGTLQSGWVKRHTYLIVGLAFVGLIFLIIVVASFAGGSGGGKVAEEPQQKQPAAPPADPFANGEFYTFYRKEIGNDELFLTILAGSESKSQIDKIVRELDYDKSKYELVSAFVLTKDEVTEKQIEEITRDHNKFNKVPLEEENFDFDQAGVLEIANSALAGERYSIASGEYVYFDSPEVAGAAAEKEQRVVGQQESSCSAMPTQLTHNAMQKIVFVTPGGGSTGGSSDRGSTVSSAPTAELKMYAIKADGTGLTQLTKTMAPEYGLTNRLSNGSEATIKWTPDGRKIESITNELGCSPDGNKKAFLSAEHVNEQENASSSAGVAANTSDIYVMNADGTNKTRITKTPETSESWPTWSPDSKKIAFTRGVTRVVKGGMVQYAAIFVINADGSDLRKLTGISTPLPVLAVWSPDGKKIAFTVGAPHYDIYLMNADGSDLRNLTKTVPDFVDSVIEPMFSPNGKKIAFICACEGYTHSDIYVINIDGTGLTRLTNDKLSNKVGGIVDIVTWV
jgi:WD40 repeat protein